VKKGPSTEALHGGRCSDQQGEPLSLMDVQPVQPTLVTSPHALMLIQPRVCSASSHCQIT
jgi:hypothetical protein